MNQSKIRTESAKYVVRSRHRPDDKAAVLASWPVVAGWWLVGLAWAGLGWYRMVD